LVLILFEAKKKPVEMLDRSFLTIKILTYYFVLLKTIIVLPMTLAFTCWMSPALYQLSSGMEIALIPISILGLLSMAVNSFLAVVLFRDHSPLRNFPFSSSVNYLD
jgi:hypothetical protein